MPTRRVLVLALAVVAAAGAAACSAPAFATGGLVDVEIVDRGRDEVLPTHRRRDTRWVAGRPGSRYAVRLRNRSGNRVLVVLSVDGVNAISGETASASQTGYVLAPYQSAEITGWRKSMNEAAAFYFTALPDSYAARTGRPDNVGVIGVAVFRERERVVELAPPAIDRAAPATAAAAQGATRERGDTAPAAPAAKAEGLLRDERLGTGHGEREFAPITRTAFERASERPDEIVRLRYDSVEKLVALGVIRPRRAPPVPEPFPGFAPDPKG
jgi:hypothetical protein